MERSTIFNGKIHYKYIAIFNSYVKLPEGTPILGKLHLNGEKIWKIMKIWEHDD